MGCSFATTWTGKQHETGTTRNRDNVSDKHVRVLGVRERQRLVVPIEVKAHTSIVGSLDGDANVAVIGRRDLARDLNVVTVIVKRVARWQLDTAEVALAVGCDLNLEVACEWGSVGMGE